MEKIYDPSGWAKEEGWGAGNLCYAACTAALRGAIEGVQISQLQIAHETAMNMNYSGVLEGTRGEKAKQYAEMFGLNVGAQPLSFDNVDKEIVEMGKPLLGDVWGLVGTGNLTSKQAPYDEQAMVDLLKAGGLLIVGTEMHSLLVYGYEPVIMEGQETGVFNFGVWDPADGSTKVWDINDFGNNDLTYVSK